MIYNVKYKLKFDYNLKDRKLVKVEIVDDTTLNSEIKKIVYSNGFYLVNNKDNLKLEYYISDKYIKETDSSICNEVNHYIRIKNIKEILE